MFLGSGYTAPADCFLRDACCLFSTPAVALADLRQPDRLDESCKMLLFVLLPPVPRGSRTTLVRECLVLSNRDLSLCEGQPTLRQLQRKADKAMRSMKGAEVVCCSWQGAA